MSEMTPPVDSENSGTVPAQPTQSTAAKLLNDFIRNRFRELATDRIGEDNVWYKSGLFNLTLQWLTRDGNTGRIRPMNSSELSGWSAPISDHFSKTIAVNANSLGANLPRVTALSGNWDARSRRAAAYAEAVFDTANRESEMDVLNPILAIQTVLWGFGVTKDTVAFDRSTEDIPIIGEQTPFGEVQAPGQTPQLGSSNPAGAPSEQVNPATGVPTTNPVADETPDVVGSVRVPAPRLRTLLPSPFAIYIPRDCQDPNISPEVYERVPYVLGEAKQLFPDYAKQLSADGSGADASGDSAYADSTSASLAALYQSQLRRFSALGTSGFGSGARQSGTSATQGVNGQDGGSDVSVSTLTAVEGWVDWARLPQKIHDAIEAEWADSPSEVEEYAKRGMSRIAAAVAYGVYAIVWNDFTLQWGENPWHGDSPYTFFMWEKNSLNPYGKGGLGIVLQPLQRQLNRLDAIHDRQMMSTGTTKILMPESQQYKRPPGDPVDVWEYDDMLGKHPPQLVPAGNAGGIPAKRAQIVAEFAELGYTQDVTTGQAPGGVDSFRGIAYLGAKAEEQRGTQRALWEQAHERRSRKILRMAKRVWTEPRKVKVAGPNNRYGAELIEGADLDFETDQLTIVEGSSRPKTLAEKEEAINTLIQGGLVDVQDSDVRDFIYDLIGMPEIDLKNELQYSKAQRDLQQLIDGVQPVSAPAQDWNIVLKVINDYTLTEEYEGLPQQIQAGILGYAAWAQELLQPPGMPPPGGAAPPAPGGPFAGQLPSKHPAQTLSKPPSKTSPQNQQLAAQAQGDAVANSVDGTAPVFHT